MDTSSFATTDLPDDDAAPQHARRPVSRYLPAIFRWRLRTLLIVVAVVGCLIGADVLWKRSGEYSEIASRHAAHVRPSRGTAEVYWNHARSTRSIFESIRHDMLETSKEFREQERASRRVLWRLHLDKVKDKNEAARYLAEQEAALVRREREEEAELQAEWRQKAINYEQLVNIYLDVARHSTEWSAYHDRLRRKYEYAASHPWLLVSPDPPPPESVWVSINREREYFGMPLYEDPEADALYDWTTRFP